LLRRAMAGPDTPARGSPSLFQPQPASGTPHESMGLREDTRTPQPQCWGLGGWAETRGARGEAGDRVLVWCRWKRCCCSCVPRWDRSWVWQGSAAPAFVPAAAGAGQGGALSKPGGAKPRGQINPRVCLPLPQFPQRKGPPPAAWQGCCLFSPRDLPPWDTWVSWGARCGCAVALNHQLDPAVTASNPHRSLAQAFYAFSSGSRGAWRQRAGEIGLRLASREGREKGKHFPSQRSRGSPALRLQQRAWEEQTACGAARGAGLSLPAQRAPARSTYPSFPPSPHLCSLNSATHGEPQGLGLSYEAVAGRHPGTQENKPMRMEKF